MGRRLYTETLRRKVPRSIDERVHLMEQYKELLNKLEGSQNGEVLEHLIKYETINTFVANNDYYITRLPSRVSDLKRLGVAIKATNMAAVSAKTNRAFNYKDYSLEV